MKKFKFISIIALSFSLLVLGFFISTKNVSADDSSLSVTTFTSWDKGGVVGYDAGFRLSGGAIFNDTQSIVIQLYSGSTLLQTNTAVKGKIVGTEFLTPFDIFGTFNYVTDGYFINTRQAEYGRNLTPTTVVATVTLLDGKVLTASKSLVSSDAGCAPGFVFSTVTGQACPVGQVLGMKSFRFTNSLKLGSKGNEVMELQKALSSKGYDVGTPDGAFGPKTKTAVTNFQISNGLEAVGSVGPRTRALLNK